MAYPTSSARPTGGNEATAHNGLVSQSTPLNQEAEHGNLLIEWLKLVGLHFDPFAILDAAADPRLSEYLVGHNAFKALWGDWNTFVFAPIGGGKTALRVRTAHDCWVGQETNRPFSIPYVPPFLEWGNVLPTLDNHLAALAQTGAEQLLLALAHRPHWLLRLDAPIQKQVGEVLSQNLLAGPLAYYLDELRQEGHPAGLKEELDPTFPPLDPPEPAALRRFCQALTASGIEGQGYRPTPKGRWHKLESLLLQHLKFRSIYVLLDGLDSAPETATDPVAIITSLSPLLPWLAQRSARDVFVKGFLPLETETLLEAHFPALIESARVEAIHWSQAQLAELLQERLYVASEGSFNSLAAIASPALPDIEDMLLSKVKRPRELLVLVRRTLLEHVNHPESGQKLNQQDVDKAIAWYHKKNHVVTTDTMEAPYAHNDSNS